MEVGVMEESSFVTKIKLRREGKKLGPFLPHVCINIRGIFFFRLFTLGSLFWSHNPHLLKKNPNVI